MSKYTQIIRARGDLELEKQVENLEKQIGADPADMLYSEKVEDIVSYRQKVLEIERDKDDFLFSLAGNKGETIETLSRKTVADLMSFAERLIQENKNG